MGGSKAERAVEKLTGSRRQAATFRRQVEKKVESKLHEVVRRQTREKTLRSMGLRQTGGTHLRQFAFNRSRYVKVPQDVYITNCASYISNYL